MRAIALAIAASGVLLLLLCIANQPNAVALYQPRYAPSNFRQGPRQFSPYNFPYETGAPEGPENNLPPVYSPQDVAQATVWTGYNYPQPVFASYSNTPAAAAPVPLAPAIFPRRRRIQISSRHDVPVIAAALRGHRQRISVLEQQMANLQSVVQKALKQPILHGQLFADAQRQARLLETLSARVHELQVQIASLEANPIPGPVAPQGPAGPRGIPGAIGRHGVQGVQGVARGRPVTASDARRILDAVAGLEQEMKQMLTFMALQQHKRFPNFSGSAATFFKRGASAAFPKARKATPTAAAAKATAATAIQTDPSIFAKVAKTFSHRMSLQQMMRSLRGKLQLGSEPDVPI